MISATHNDDTAALHSMFPSYTLVRLSELLRHHKGHMKRTIRAVKAELKRSAKAELSVVIVGGGIGGLALALALQHRGVCCHVFERDTHFDQRRQGYGLTMQQGASALRSLGFRIAAGDNLGVHSTRHVVLTSEGKQVGEWGRRKWGRDEGKAKASKSNFHIPRQALRRLLLDALRPGTVIWGHRFVRYSEPLQNAPRPRAETLSPCINFSMKHCNDREVGFHRGRIFALESMLSPGSHPMDIDFQQDAFKLDDHKYKHPFAAPAAVCTLPRHVVEFTTEDGSAARHMAHVLVGCDGLNGSVRKQLVKEELCPLEYLGVLVVLGIVDNLIPGSVGSEIVDGKSAFQMSDSEARLFGMPFDETKSMWQLSFPMDQDEAAALAKEGAAALKEEALRRCGAWAPPVPQLLIATGVDLISGYPVFDRLQLTSECFEAKAGMRERMPATLLGDAAHPMSPFKGQGANQAIVDAVVLARELSECFNDGPVPALQRYEAEMMERSAKKVVASREAAAFLHSEVAIGEGDKTRAEMARLAEGKKTSDSGYPCAEVCRLGEEASSKTTDDGGYSCEG